MLDAEVQRVDFVWVVIGSVIEMQRAARWRPRPTACFYGVSKKNCDILIVVVQKWELLLSIAFLLTIPFFNTLYKYFWVAFITYIWRHILLYIPDARIPRTGRQSAADRTHRQAARAGLGEAPRGGPLRAHPSEEGAQAQVNSETRPLLCRI